MASTVTTPALAQATPPTPATAPAQRNKAPSNKVLTKRDLEAKLREYEQRLEDQQKQVDHVTSLNVQLTADIETAKISNPTPLNSNGLIACPKAVKGSHEPAFYMSDIRTFLNDMDDVEDGSEYYRSMRRMTRFNMNRAGMDLSKTYSELKHSEQVTRVCKSIRQEYPAAARFENDWATRAFIRQYLRNNSWKRKRTDDHDGDQDEELDGHSGSGTGPSAGLQRLGQIAATKRARLEDQPTRDKSLSPDA